MVGDYDWFSPKAMNDYFVQLYSRMNNFDEKGMKDYLYDCRYLKMETAAKEFRLIDDDSVSVIVNWKDSLELVGRLKAEGTSYTLAKLLG